MKLLDSLKHAFNVFAYDATARTPPIEGASYGYNPSRYRLHLGNEKSIINAICNRMAIDAASIDINHVDLDDDRRFKDVRNSKLNQCLTVEANIDQSGRAFIQDVVLSMLDEGVVAVVPVDTDLNPDVTGGYDILSLRTGRITQWYPKSVKIELYDERDGNKKEVTVNKANVAIIENPLYSVMNEHNSTMQRLIRKLALMDGIDEEVGSGNLNLLVQLPYAVKTELQKQTALDRITLLEDQLKGNRLGIGYVDSTEKITQLNRPLENQFLKQIEYLTNQLFAQLGITQGVLDGTADDKTMNNYYTRTIEPIVTAIVDEFHRKFLTKTARSQGQAIMYFRDPFKLIPISEVPEFADKFTRNEILSSNEFRQIVGRKPSKDPAADELRNKNLSQSTADIEAKAGKQLGQPEKPEDDNEENKEE